MITSLDTQLQKVGIKVIEQQQWRGVWFLRTNQGDKVLKKWHFSNQELAFSISAMDYVSQNGFFRVPQVTLFAGDSNNIEGDSTYLLMERLPGREANYRNREDLTKAAENLAKIHLAARGFWPSAPVPEKMRWGKWPEIFTHRLTELQSFGQKGLYTPMAFDRIYAGALKVFIKEGQEVLDLLNHYNYFKLSAQGLLEGGLCHHDYADHNVLIDGQQVYILDFDYSICDFAMHDLASLIIRVCKRNSTWDIVLAKYILAKYAAVKPLEPKDWYLMKIILKFPQDFWQLGVWYYIEKRPWPLTKYIQVINKLLSRQKQREVFLKGFTRLCNQRY